MTPFHEIISYGHIENKLMYPHRNPGMEIVLVEQGSLEWAVESVPEVLVPGTVFFTLPWQAHGSMNIREPRNKLFFILFELQDDYAESAADIRMPSVLGFDKKEQETLSRIFTSAPCHAWAASGLLTQTFPELIRRLESKSPLDHSVAMSLLRTLIVELANTIGNEPEASDLISPTVRKVRFFLQSMMDSLDQPWTLDEMAETCGIKRTYFASIVRQLTGYPPMQYFNRIRFEKASSLLRDTNESITTIAFECGYGSSQYFAENFKKFSRMTPSEYRQSLPELQKILEANWSHPESRSVADERRRMKQLGLE